MAAIISLSHKEKQKLSPQMNADDR